MSVDLLPTVRLVAHEIVGDEQLLVLHLRFSWLWWGRSKSFVKLYHEWVDRTTGKPTSWQEDVACNDWAYLVRHEKAFKKLKERLGDE